MAATGLAQRDLEPLARVLRTHTLAQSRLYSHPHLQRATESRRFHTLALSRLRSRLHLQRATQNKSLATQANARFNSYQQRHSQENGHTKEAQRLHSFLARILL